MDTPEVVGPVERDPIADIVAKFGYPPVLAKACYDKFDYALRLATGEVWCFVSATPIDREWVELRGIESNAAWSSSISFPRHGNPRRKITFERCVDVRVSSIVWVADAPFGS